MLGSSSACCWGVCHSAACLSVSVSWQFWHCCQFRFCSCWRYVPVLFIAVIYFWFFINSHVGINFWLCVGQIIPTDIWQTLDKLFLLMCFFVFVLFFLVIFKLYFLLPLLCWNTVIYSVCCTVPEEPPEPPAVASYESDREVMLTGWSKHSGGDDERMNNFDISICTVCFCCIFY